MSNFHGYICDICGKITNYNGILRFKLKSGSFVHYIVNDRYSPDEKNLIYVLNVPTNLRNGIHSKIRPKFYLIQEKEVTRMNVKPIHSQNENKKYNCTKVVDFIHEYDRICKTFNTCNDCPVNYCCNYSILSILSTAKNKDIPKVISTVQEWSDTNPERIENKKPTLTENDITVLKALQIMGYHWIATDKDVVSCVYIDKPVKCYDIGVWNSSYDVDCVNYNFSFLSWEDKEPTNIDWLLGGNDNE